MKRLWSVIVLASALGCELSFCAPFPVAEDNTAPVARLVWPQLADVDDPVRFDGEQTSDVDGPIFVYEMTFGDGTEVRTSDNGVFEHSYAAAGTYDFVYLVRDEHGAKGEVNGTVTVVNDLDNPICDCDLPCFEPAACTPEGCFIAATSGLAPEDGGTEDEVFIDALNCADPEPEPTDAPDAG